MATQTEMTQKKSDGTNGSMTQRDGAPETVLRPSVDIFETVEGITLHVDMPGVSKEGLNLRIEGNNLLVEGVIGIASQESMTALYADIRATLYRRSFVLGNELETAKIEANLKDGLLSVRIPKRAELRPRRIDVQA